jgi:uncharacterized integral membrane protein (TIGR00698 family)
MEREEHGRGQGLGLEGAVFEGTAGGGKGARGAAAAHAAAPLHPVHPAHPPASIVPGVLLAGMIAALAFVLRTLPGVSNFSPMIIAILLGIAFHNIIGTPRRAKAGITFSLRRILRAAIVLLGLQLSFQQVIAVGLNGLTVIVLTLIGTFLFTKWAGRWLGVDAKLSELIAAGTSICGASAVVATNAVTQGHDEEVTYAVACVTVFGSVSMFLYPLFPALLHLSPTAYGLWAGASIHEIAQVVAAAFQDGQVAGQIATVAKLSRVMMLAPLVLTLSFLANQRLRRQGRHVYHKRPPLPYFVLGFIAFVALSSVVTLPPVPKYWIVQGTTFLLSLALAAMGLETDIRKVLAKGARPIALGAASWLFISGVSLGLVYLLG